MTKEIGQKRVEETIDQAGREKLDSLRSAAGEVAGVLRDYDPGEASDDQLLDLASQVTSLNRGKSSLRDRINAVEKGQKTAFDGIETIATGLVNLEAGLRSMRLSPERKKQVHSQVISWISGVLAESVAGTKKHPEFPFAEVTGNTSESLKIGGNILRKLEKAGLLGPSDFRRVGNKAGKGTKVWLSEHAAALIQESMKLRQELREADPGSYFYINQVKGELLERVRAKEEKTKEK